MKHLIIVKWKEDIVIGEDIFREIENLFAEAKKLQGIHDVAIHQNIMHLPKRYDFMIEIEMEKDSLSLFDNSGIHSEWKEKYANFIQSKVIFDYS